MEYNSEVRKNRAVVERLANLTLTLAITETPFRGHDETDKSDNKGPFKEFIRHVMLQLSLINSVVNVECLKVFGQNS